VEVRDPKVNDSVTKYVSYSIKGIDRSGSFEVLNQYEGKNYLGEQKIF